MADKTDAEIFAELMGEGAIAPPEPTNTAPAAPASADPGPTAANDPTPLAPDATAQDAPTPGDPALNTTSQPDDSVPDWVKALPQEGREAWDAMQASYADTQAALSRERQARAAVEGRLAPVQRKLSALERQLAGQPQTSPREPVPATGAAGTTATNGDSLDSIFDSPGWRKFEQEFPEEAEVQRKAFQTIGNATSERIRSLEQLIENTVRPRLAQHDHDAEQRRLEQEREALTKAHPDWQEINVDPTFTAWLNDWVEKQPAPVRAVYSDETKLRQFLTDSAFTSGLLDEYKRDLYVAEQYLASFDGGTAPAPAPTAPAPAPAVTPAAPTARGVVDPLLRLSAAPDVRASPAPRVADISALPDAEQFAVIFDQIGGNR